MNEAKETARRQGRTLRDLIEVGLRTVLKGCRSAAGYELPDRSVGGNGLQGGLTYDEWGKVLEIANERTRS